MRSRVIRYSSRRSFRRCRSRTCMANPSFPRPWGGELLQRLPALGARVVENSVDLVDVGLGLRAVGADTAVDESLVCHRGHPTLQNRSRNPLNPLATPLA